MAAAGVPLLPPPQPRFPTRFGEHDEHSIPSGNGAQWPEDPDEVDEDRAAGKSGEGEVVWELKTDREEHVERLESRLSHLRSQPPPTLADSAIPPTLAPSFELHDAIEEEESLDLTDAEDAQAVGDEEEEGKALLSSVQPVGVVEDTASRHSTLRNKSSTSGDELGDSQDEDADASGNDEEFSRSRLPHRLPPNVATKGTQRISFNNSVRIGGARGGHHSHRHPPFFPTDPTERTSLFAPQARTVSAPPSLLVASVTAPSPLSRSISPAPSDHRGRSSASPSRSTSPGPSRSRRPSLASSHLSSSHTYLQHGSVYSTSPASYAASRSSSPCSSIYAPLQRPSKTCPNPMFVRPAGALRGVRRSRSGSVLSFQDFLRNGGRFPELDDEDSDDDDDGDTDEPDRPDYRDLVEQQRQRKAKWEARRKAKEAQRRKRERRASEGSGGGGFWDRLAQLLALGIAGSSSARGVAAPVNVLVAPPTPVSHRATSPSRPSPLRRPPSNGSLASASSAAGDLSTTTDDDGDGAYIPIFHRRPHPSSSSSAATKSEADVRFGPAPRRYFTRAWIKHQVRVLVRAVKRAWTTAKQGWERAVRERRLVGEDGYEEVV
ncbi:hypothetical protein JCM6882_002080 [Rhodosporidiobolus microsporus]